jgi:hypothetical protein
MSLVRKSLPIILAAQNQSPLAVSIKTALAEFYVVITLNTL